MTLFEYYCEAQFLFSNVFNKNTFTAHPSSITSWRAYDVCILHLRHASAHCSVVILSRFVWTQPSNKKQNLPAMFQEPWDAYRTTHKCLTTQYVYHCYFQPQPTNVATYTIDNYILSISGYATLELSQLYNDLPKHVQFLTNVKSLYVNSNTKLVIYDDINKKQFRYVFCYAMPCYLIGVNRIILIWVFHFTVHDKRIDR